MDGNSHEGKLGLGEPAPVKIVITPPSPRNMSCAGDFQDVKGMTEVASDCGNSATGINAKHAVDVSNNRESFKEPRQIYENSNSGTARRLSESAQLLTNNGLKEETGTENIHISPSEETDAKNLPHDVTISHNDTTKSETNPSEIDTQNNSEDYNEITAVRVSVGIAQEKSDEEVKNPGISIGVNVGIATVHSEKIKGNIDVGIHETNANTVQDVGCVEKHKSKTEDNGCRDEHQDEPKESVEKDSEVEKDKEEENKQLDLLKGADVTSSCVVSERPEVSGDSTSVEFNDQTVTVNTDDRNEGIPAVPNTSQRDGDQANLSKGETNLTKDKNDLTSTNISTGTPFENEGNASNKSGENESHSEERKTQSSESRHLAFANVGDSSKMEASVSDLLPSSPESKLYFEHDAIANKFKEHFLKYHNAKGFIPQTNKEHAVATNYRKDLILFCTVFAVYGTNYRKMSPRIRRQLSFAALFETRITQYDVFTGTITKRIGKDVLTIERIANLAPHIVCQIVRDGNGKELDLSALGVPIPHAMQTTMFAGICPSGPPAYCYYFYYQLSRKFFNRPVSINEIKKRVATTFHSLLTTKERQNACVKLNLAATGLDGEWMWKKHVRDVFEASEKEWDKIRETDFSARRVSLDFHDLLKSIEFENIDLFANINSTDKV